jgi:hypothetical protein
MDELADQNQHLKYVAVSLDAEVDDATQYIRTHSLYQKYSDRYFIVLR